MTILLTHDSAQFPAGRNARSMWRSSMSLVACALIAIALPAAAVEKTAGTPLAKTTGEATPSAVFTGEFVDGKPLYRLPPINVVAHRNALARTTPVARTVQSATPRARGASGPSAKRQVAFSRSTGCVGTF
jgi:hypothetical protein